MDDSLRAIEASIEENVRLGYIEYLGVDESGQITYRLTPAGRERVEMLMFGSASQEEEG